MDRPKRTDELAADCDGSLAPVVGGVSGLIVQNRKVLLIRRGRPPYEGCWSLPGGGVEPGERLRETVKREVLEETGLMVEVGLLAGYREEILSNGHFIMPAFRCAVIGGKLQAGDDATAVEFVDPREAMARQLVPALEDVLRDAGLLD